MPSWNIEKLIENYKCADKINQQLSYHYEVIEEDNDSIKTRSNKINDININVRINKLHEEYNDILGNDDYTNKVKEIMIMILDYEYKDVINEPKMIMIDIILFTKRIYMFLKKNISFITMTLL